VFVTIPGDITVGPDNALWFTGVDTGGPHDHIGRITTAGVVTAFPLPIYPRPSYNGYNNLAPYAITTGPDGALWFTSQRVNVIGRITTGGAVTIYRLPGGTSGDEFWVSRGITMGPDGALWITNDTITNDTDHASIVRAAPAPGDVTPPTLIVPATIVVEGTSPAGATVTYSVAATDDQDPNPVVVCSPPSGSVFPLLASIVSCTATDATGNSATETFQVVVLDARQQLEETIDLIATYHLTRLGTSLADKLQLASGYIVVGDIGKACGVLTGFLNEVRAQRGKALTVDQATELTMRVNRIRNVIGC